MERRSGPSSSSRRDPLQEDPARWSATTALELAARERVFKWRVEHGLEEDSDFAFRWSSHEEAIASSGHSVAHEWLRIRAEQSGALLPAAARVMEELPRPTPSMAPSMIREPVSTKKKTMFGRKRPGVRLKANPSDAPEAVCQRVEALSAVMMRLGALMPSGSMSRSLHEEWRQACLRLSQRLVTQAEAITVVNALKTADELQGFMRGRDPGRLYPLFIYTCPRAGLSFPEVAFQQWTLGLGAARPERSGRQKGQKIRWWASHCSGATHVGFH